jgi:hypothetical protein
LDRHEGSIIPWGRDHRHSDCSFDGGRVEALERFTRGS